MNFLQFFIWGSWLLTIGAFWFQTKHWSGIDFGRVFSTMGIVSLFMPAIAGILADRFMNAEKLYAFFHFMGGIFLFILPQINNPDTFFWVMLANMSFYMPTIALSITVAYTVLKKYGYNVIDTYPPIRVFGTIGFIVALWTVSLLKLETSPVQFYIASGASFLLAAYALTLPACPPPNRGKKTNLVDAMGLRAFTLFKQYKMAVFFIFAMLLGAALQLTNAYGDTFIHDFGKIDQYKAEIAVQYPAILMSISQISETLFILTIPFFLKKFGIKKVMLMSMIAWVFRFGLFAYGNPALNGGLWMLVLSCIIYGMAFDFFNISGSLFVETQVQPEIRASSQGLFMLMTNGLGAFLGSTISGWMIDKFYKLPDGSFDWHHIWLSFASYALVIAVLFVILFKHKHNPNEIAVIKH
jgi:NHS family xanthosine MFS transporter